MVKTKDSDIKNLIVSLDKKVDLLTQKVDLIDENVKKQDVRLWAFGGIVLTASLATIFKLIAFP